MWFIQYIDTYQTEDAARDSFAFQQTLVDYKGGRILPPTPEKPGWRVQTFFEDAPEAQWLADGCRRVFVPDSQKKTMGIAA